MRTSATGWSRVNRSRDFTLSLGFTLLEIMIVLFLLGLIAGILSLRIEGTLSGGDLRLASRMIIGEINSLRGKAVATRQEQTLTLNVDDNTLVPVEKASSEDTAPEWGREEKTSSLQEGKRLPKGVDLEDVYLFSEGKVQEGEAMVRFFANGCVDRALIHLRNEENDVYTLEVNPLTGHVRLYDSYVEQRLSE